MTSSSSSGGTVRADRLVLSGDHTSRQHDSKALFAMRDAPGLIRSEQ
ncbi:hypothetical protein [Novosphingobium clariflavum]|uniref:Uncharacterized protein n=1 Tax=Novosphingobium clariflavum TaxID=2029884 RepID=A0ABV6SCU7_9SPHN